VEFQMAEIASASEIEAEKLELERKKLQLEYDKLALERFKAWWSGVAVIVPSSPSPLPLVSVSGVNTRRPKTISALKAAEIIMNTDNPTVTRNKAKALASIFPKQLPPDFGTALNPEDFPGDESGDIVRAKKELLTLLAARPEKTAEILVFWKSLFPDDSWITSFEEALSHNHSLQRTDKSARR
jgi:hypothetical protein